MKLQTFKYFVQIVNEGSYTKAAEKCYVSQPALSKAISEFENELNCVLFQRNGRKVELTEMGREVYDEVKIVLETCDLIREIASGKKNSEEPIKLGYVFFSYLKSFYDDVKIVNELTLTTVYESTAIIRKKLIDDELDIILVPNSTVEGLTNVNVHYFNKKHLNILVHSSHPLFGAEKIVYKDLESVSMISWDKEDLPQVAEAFDREFLIHSMKPNVVARAKKMGDVVSLMSQHNAVSLQGPITTNLPEDEYRMIPILDSEEKYGVCAIWKKNNKKESLQRLIGHL